MSSSQDLIRTAYDIASAAYAQQFLSELDGKPFDRELLNQFAALVDVGRPVLDIGCGPGHTTAHLTSLGLRATGVDLSPQMIAMAAETFPKHALKWVTSFAFRVPLRPLPAFLHSTASCI
jgi:2-polyprenyl-3-methyl-5-hydroxy-6-metoxy-1,4-benzoquinol methylase